MNRCSTAFSSPVMVQVVELQACVLPVVVSVTVYPVIGAPLSGGAAQDRETWPSSIPSMRGTPGAPGAPLTTTVISPRACRAWSRVMTWMV